MYVLSFVLIEKKKGIDLRVNIILKILTHDDGRKRTLGSVTNSSTCIYSCNYLIKCSREIQEACLLKFVDVKPDEEHLYVWNGIYLQSYTTIVTSKKCVTLCRLNEFK